MAPVPALVVLSLAACLVAASPLHAQPVAINDAKGQGLLVRHAANCFALLPSHVHADDRRPLALFTAAPQARGSGYVVFRRAEPDLAVAEIVGEAAERCERRWSYLPGEVSRLLNRGTPLDLVRISPQGTTERLAMRVERIGWEKGYQYVHAASDAATGERREAFQGSSGAFLFAGDVPVAMVLNADPDDAGSVRALRLEEIREPVGRWLQAGALAGGVPARAPATADAETVPFRVVEWSRAPAAPEFAPTGLADGTGAYRGALDQGPVVIVAEVEGEDAVAVARLRIETPAVAPGVAPPKLAVVEISTAAAGERWTQIWAGDLPAAGGRREIAVNGLVRRLRLSIVSAWQPGTPVEIRRLTLVPAAP